MTDVLTHRGPDDEGYFINTSGFELSHGWHRADGTGNVGLGHRRLSIIDLSSGHQPMSNEDGSVWIVFNGEIFNFQDLRKELIGQDHVFRTNSDTEVIIHGYEEWGRECVRRFRGMFAFAIWDRRRQCLFLARDRLGIKPLYYYEDDSKFLFGSEIKAILQHPGVSRKINSRSLYDYLSYLYIPTPNTIYEGIHKLPAGHILQVNESGRQLHKYWDIDFTTHNGVRDAEWCELIIDKLREAVAIRLISDVPLGAFLSGGVDSSAVVALMSGLQSRPVKTSSIGFREQRYNELPYARKIADAYKTEHHEVTVTADVEEVLNLLVWHFDEPFADSSAVPSYYVSKAAREKVTVALSGDGGDENFAGYRRYYFDNLENYIRRMLPGWFRRSVIRALAGIYPKADNLPQIFRAKTLLTNLSRDPVAGYYNSMTWFQVHGSRIFSSFMRREVEGYHPISHFHNHASAFNGLDPLSRIQYIDIKTYLVDDILTKVDRTSMANSLEVRVPLLDHEFMELVARMPPSLKMNRHHNKFIFKKALEPYLPNDCLYRPKMGFSIPLSRWLKHGMKSIFEKQVLSPNGFCLAYLDKKAVETMWNSHLQGSGEYGFELWSILFLELWGRRWT